MNQLDPRSTARPMFDDGTQTSAAAPFGEALKSLAATPPPSGERTLRAVLREDLGRYLDLDEAPSRLAVVRAVLATEGMWPLFAYRLGRWLLARGQARGLRRIAFAALWVVQFAVETFSRWALDIRLDLRADIGPGLYVGHFKSIHVGPGVTIGRSCNIGQMCFVAATGHGGRAGAPVIGDRVYLGVGSKVLGPLRVGNDVALGANAVLMEDVPDRAVVVGNPARVISLKGSEDFISIKKRDGAAAAPPQAVRPRPDTPVCRVPPGA